MTQQQNAKPAVAIVGVGNIGKIVAGNLVKGGRPVIVADRTDARAEALAAELGSLAQARSIAEAMQAADIVIPALTFGAVEDMIRKDPTPLEGKIIVDVSSPVAPNGKGGFVKIVSDQESAGELLAAILPAGAKLAKAFGTLSAASLASAAFRETERALLFYVTDEREINATIEELIRDSGFEPMRIGGLDQSIRIEVFGDLHELGALGRVVTEQDLKEMALI